MKILGSKFFGHDSAAAYIDFDAQTIFAMSTERVTRIKHDTIDIEPILALEPNFKPDYVCHSFRNFEKDSNSWETSRNVIPDLKKLKLYRAAIKPKYIKDLAIERNEKNKLLFTFLLKNPVNLIKYILIKFENFLYQRLINTPSIAKNTVLQYISKKTKVSKEKVFLFDHHLCHAFASYVCSPYFKTKAISLTIDGHGDGSFSKAYLIENDQIKLISNSYSPKSIKYNGVFSIGEVYGNFTEALGFRRNSDEGKTEALAAYGNRDAQLYKKLIKSTLVTHEGISFTDEFDFFYSSENLEAYVGKVGRENFASTIQDYLEDVMTEFVTQIHMQHPEVKTLCLSGGVAANIIMSLALWERTNFENIYILPSMGDEGTALGSAFLKANELKLDLTWVGQKYAMPYLGDQVSSEMIAKSIAKFDSLINAKNIGPEWPKHAALDVHNGQIIGLFHGKMEFGPRALGNRSIVANPANPNVKDRINGTVKRRPSFQPFCPSILEEERERLFEKSFSHKYMATAFRLKPEHIQSLPCAAHIDGTARPQFVSEADNPDFYSFLRELKFLNGYGVSINTSFNLHGRTVVRTADDAITDFLDCKLDALYLEGYKITRKQ